MIQSYKKYLETLAYGLAEPDRTKAPWKYAGVDALFFEQTNKQTVVPPLFVQQSKIILTDVEDFFRCYPEQAQKYFFDYVATNSFATLWNMFAHLYAQRRWVLYVPPGTQCTDIVQLMNTTACIEQGTIIVAQGASVRLHEQMRASSGKRIKNVDIILEPNAFLEFIVEEQDASDVAAFTQYRCFVYDHAQLAAVFLQQGGVVRTMLFDLFLSGSGARADLKGLSVVERNQQAVVLTWQKHVAPATQSSLVAKSLVADAARSVYYGTITLDKAAERAEAYQQNKNIVLGKTAHVFSQPNLEIHTHNVRCKHGSATGTFDISEMLYMHSRGLSPETARILLCKAFIQDVTHAAMDSVTLPV